MENKNNGANIVLGEDKTKELLGDISWATSDLNEAINKLKEIELKKQVKQIDSDTYAILQQIKKLDEYNTNINNTLNKLNNLNDVENNLDTKIEELKKENNKLTNAIDTKINNLNDISNKLETKANLLNKGLNYKAIIISFVIGCFIGGSAIRLLNYKEIATLQVKVFMLQKTKGKN